MSVLNLLWAFDFVSTETKQRDQRCPIQYDDFAPVRPLPLAFFYQCY